MGYDIALNKAWDDLLGLNSGKIITVKFLADEYTVDTQEKKVLSMSCNVAAKDYASILILHYLKHKISGLPELTGEWLSFKELSGIEGYYPAFRKRVIEPIIRKYGNKPQGLLEVLDRLPGKRVDQADMGIVLEVFEDVPALICLWKQDEEFGAEAGLLFDKNIVKIFCTEDIVVLAEFVARQL